MDNKLLTKSLIISDFCKRLEPVGRILDCEGWHVWCCSAIEDASGKTHVFFARWPYESGHNGWIHVSEIAHAVADQPEGPYEVTGTVLKGRGGRHWDAATIHNPTVYAVDGKFALFYMGNSDGKVATQRVGLAMADSLEGSWERIGDGPVVDTSCVMTDWDSYITTNPALLLHPNGQFWLYYKVWDRHNSGFRKIGLAIADRIEGPYRKHPDNPLVDFSPLQAQMEDPYVFFENGVFHMVTRDKGVFSNRSGLYLRSHDGIHWSEPMIGFETSDAYFDEPLQRLERPQVLMRNGTPAYVFFALMGGKAGTSSGAVMRVKQ